jgi:integrase
MIRSRKRTRDGRTVYDVKLRTPDGRTFGRTFETKAEAKTWEARQLVERAEQTWVDPRTGKMAFSEAAAIWLAASAHKRPATVERDRAVIANHLLPTLGDRKLASIRAADLQGMVNQWMQTMAPGTVVRNYAVARAIFNHAVNTDLLAKSPCRGVKVPPAQPRESPLVDAADLQRLAAAMPRGQELFPYIGAVLGLRWAEVAGLRVASLNFLNGTMSIERQWTRGEGGRMVSQRPKTLAGRRTIAVPDWLMELLAAHLAERGLTGADGDAVVFVSAEGRALEYSNCSGPSPHDGHEPGDCDSARDGDAGSELGRRAG